MLINTMKHCTVTKTTIFRTKNKSKTKRVPWGCSKNGQCENKGNWKRLRSSSLARQEAKKGCRIKELGVNNL